LGVVKEMVNGASDLVENHESKSVDEESERPVIVAPHAVAHPRTVVVQSHNAGIAVEAVDGSRRTVQLA